jgi:uncharacterized protein with ATP-grasp and redox domains
LKSSLDCLECVARQALRAARIATNDPDVQRRILDAAAARIPTMNLDESPAVLSLVCYEAAAELSGKTDPYRELKDEQNRLALSLEPELRELLDASDDRLLTALHLSAAGNIIDLGTMQQQHIDLRATIEQVLRESFAVDHSEAFRESLSRCRDLLFFLDNAGEIVFDKLLIEELLKHTSVTAVVKAGPIINDATRKDAEDVGLARICEVIDNGGAFIGSPLDRIPRAFRERMDRADVIFGKGQGNFETLDDYPGDVFLMLRAKCEVVARHMGVRYGQVGLISTRKRACTPARV